MALCSKPVYKTWVIEAMYGNGGIGLTIRLFLTTWCPSENVVFLKQFIFHLLGLVG